MGKQEGGCCFFCEACWMAKVETSEVFCSGTVRGKVPPVLGSGKATLHLLSSKLLAPSTSKCIEAGPRGFPSSLLPLLLFPFPTPLPFFLLRSFNENCSKQRWLSVAPAIPCVPSHMCACIGRAEVGARSSSGLFTLLLEAWSPTETSTYWCHWSGFPGGLRDLLLLLSCVSGIRWHLGEVYDLVFTLLSVERGVASDSSRAIFPAHSFVFTSLVKEGIPESCLQECSCQDVCIRTFAAVV